MLIALFGVENFDFSLRESAFYYLI
jgi:hypothetical protein